ncbi:MAG: DMT family transporter [Firmicutes bacterium]|nr:DMT family transporter [Bacillota bacterium]
MIAILAAIAWSLANVFIGKGQENSRPLDGVFVSLISNLVIYTVVVGVMVVMGTFPPLTAGAVFFFALGGLFGSTVGRSFIFTAISYLGPSRVSAIKGSVPVYTLIFAFLFLGEQTSVVDVAAILLVTLGIVWIALEKKKPSLAAVQGEVAASGEFPPLPRIDDSLSPEDARRQPAAEERSPARFPFRLSPRAIGFTLAALGSFSHAMSVITRKAGLNQVSSPVVGVFFGLLVAVSLLLISFWSRGELGNLRRMPRKDFLYNTGAGVSTSAALFLSLWSFTLTNVAVAQALISSQPIFTILLSYLIIRKGETRGLRLVTSASLVVAGGAIIFM